MRSVRDSASSERENIGNSTSLLSRVHVTLEGTRRNESLPPQERYWLVLLVSMQIVTGPSFRSADKRKLLLLPASGGAHLRISELQR
jgi:hypothetical protein